jgi:hypothetical protein
VRALLASSFPQIEVSTNQIEDILARIGCSKGKAPAHDSKGEARAKEDTELAQVGLIVDCPRGM